MDKTIKQLKESLETALVDYSTDSNLALRPQLLINDYHKGNKVLTDLISELSTCDEFLFSVAFITTSGVVTLLETLKELEQTSSAKDVKWCAGENLRGFISYRFTAMPRLAS